MTVKTICVNIPQRTSIVLKTHFPFHAASNISGDAAALETEHLSVCLSVLRKFVYQRCAPIALFDAELFRGKNEPNIILSNERLLSAALPVTAARPQRLQKRYSFEIH